MDTTTLPRHALTGVLAVGWRKARTGEDPAKRYPIWPVRGGAEDDDTEKDPEEDPDPEEDDPEKDPAEDPDPEEDAALGPAGTKALEAEKARRKAEATKRRAAETKVAELEQQLAAGSKKDGEPDADQIRREATATATAKANERIIRSEVRAAAAGKLSDPRDALRFIDLSKFEVDEDGQVDEDDVAEAVEQLVKDRPYLAAATAKRFQGSGDGGARKGSAGPKQLGEKDVKKMTAEQIDAARRKGQLRDYLGG